MSASKSYLYVLFSIILLSSVIILPAKNSAFATVGTWDSQTSGIFGTLNSVSFVDGSNGWAVSTGGIILFTANGGESWTRQTSPISTTLNSVSFVDQNNGWAVGNSGFILFTTDGGLTWDSQSNPTSTHLNSVSFFDENNGWAVGDDSTILSTTNGGDTWTEQSSPTTIFAESVFFVSATHGWIVGDAGTILSTTNGGNTWTEQTSGISTHLNSVSFVNQNNGWAVGDSGIILSTEDGGSSWDPQTSGTTTNNLNSVSFVNQNNGWAVGGTGTILFTTDGGDTWNPQLSGTGHSLTSVSFVDQNNAWAVGTNGVILRGSVDNTPPPVPVISTTTRTIIADSSFVITGTAEVGSTVTLTQNGSPLTSTTTIADAQMNWSIGVTLEDGPNVFTARTADVTGNTSDASGSVTITFRINNQAPVIVPISDQTVLRGQTTTYQVTASDPDGDTLRFSLESSTGVMGFSSAGSAANITPLGGLISIIPDNSVGNDMLVALRVIVTDGHAGGTDRQEFGITLRNAGSSPSPPEFTNTVRIVTDELLSITGTAETGSTVTLTQNGNELSDDTATATNGIWSIGVTLQDGDNEFTARTTDVASNTSGVSGSLTITFDGTPPPVPVITTLATTVTDSSFAIQGTAEAGSTVTLTQNGNSLIPVTAVSDGAWRSTVTLVDGDNTFTATAQDAAGNTSGVSGSVIISFDGTVPSPSPVNTWDMQASGTSIFLNSVSFVDESHGWAVGGTGTILSTTNGGTIWTEQSSPTSRNLDSVSFVDEDNGWAVGFDVAIISTTDGGSNWTEQESGTTRSLNSVSFVDESHGWAVGADGDIISTTDGGSNWTEQTSPNLFSRLISFVDESHGWAVGADGDIISTTDGGENWTEQESGTSEVLNSVSFVDQNRGWAVGADGTIISTTDGGENWTEQTSGTSEVLNSVSFVDQNRGLVVGNNGIILSTTDGGENWDTQPSGTSEGLSSVSFVDKNNAWAVGSNGVILRGSADNTAPPVPVITTTTTPQPVTESSFTIIGTAEADSTITLTNNNSPVTPTTTADSNGDWTVIVTLSNGDNTFTATAQDATGNISAPSGSLTITLEINQAPVIESISDQTILRGHTTTYQVEASDPDGDTLTFSLIGSTGASVESLGASITLSGLISITNNPSDNFLTGLVVTVTDGNGGTATEEFGITLRPVGTLPDPPEFTNTVTTVNDSSFTITGTAEADSTVTLTQNNSVLDTNTATAVNGFWSIDVTLKNGDNTFTATTTDVAGTISGASDSLTITLDSVIPIITTMTQTVNDSSFTITGTAEAGSTVTLSNNGNELPDTATADSSDNTWSIDVNLTEGDNEFTATATDAAGNTSGVSDSHTITFEINHAPVIEPISDQTVLRGQTTTYQAVASDLNDGDTLTFSLHGRTGTSTAPFGNLHIDSTIDPTLGLISITPDSSNEDVNALRVTVTDGNGSTATEEFGITIREPGTSPNPPEFTNAVTTSSGLSFTITGTAEADSTITLTQNGSVLGANTATATNGIWSIDVTLAEDDNTFTATATDAAGNDASAPSDTLTITLGDNQNPVIEPISDQTVLRGQTTTYQVMASDPNGDTLTFSLQGNTGTLTNPFGTDNIDSEIDSSSGLISITPDDAPLRALKVTVTDGRGGTAMQEFGITIREPGTSPNPPTFTNAVTTSNDSSFTVTGTAEADSTITLTQNGSVLGANTDTATATNGIWSIDVTLVDGTNTFTATATDAATNTSGVSNSLTITLDTVPPVITLTGDNPQDIDLGAGYTELGATADDGSDVDIDSSSFIDRIGSYTITYSSTDEAGNEATPVTRTVSVVIEQHVTINPPATPNAVTEFEETSLTGTGTVDVSDVRVSFGGTNSHIVDYNITPFTYLASAAQASVPSNVVLTIDQHSNINGNEIQFVPGTVVNIDGTIGNTQPQPLTDACPCEVSLTYNDSALRFDEDTLVMYHFTDDGTTREWEVLTTITHDTTNNVLTAQTDSFSPFALGGSIAPVSPQSNDINSSNGGSSSNDWKKKPTFGKSWEISGAQLVENGFTFNDYTLDITDNFHTDFVLTESIIGDSNHVDIKVYTDKILRDVTLSLGVPEIGKISDAETDIIIQLDRDYTIPDDYTITEIIHEQKESLVNEEDTHSSISKVKCTSNSPDELCYTIEIDFSISAPLKSNVLAISATDFDRRNTVTYINDGVEFTGESLLEPAVNSIYSKKGSQYEMETITLTQQDRRYQIWEDDNGYLWTQNNVGTWFQITTPENTRDDDPYSSVMTRMHSEHASLVLDEQERATLLFDSTKLVSVPAETFSYDFTGTSKDQQQSKMEMFAYELEIEESKAQAIIDMMLNPSYHNNNNNNNNNNRHTSSSYTDNNNR